MVQRIIGTQMMSLFKKKSGHVHVWDLYAVAMGMLKTFHPNLGGCHPWLRNSLENAKNILFRLLEWRQQGFIPLDVADVSGESLT